MLPDRVSNPGPLTYESGALPIALRGPASRTTIKFVYISQTNAVLSFCHFFFSTNSKVRTEDATAKVTLTDTEYIFIKLYLTDMKYLND